MKKLLVCFVFALVFLSGCVEKRVPRPVVISGDRWLSCESMDAETRTAYNCYDNTGQVFASEYHLSDFESWGKID